MYLELQAFALPGAELARTESHARGPADCKARWLLMVASIVLMKSSLVAGMVLLVAAISRVRVRKVGQADDKLMRMHNERRKPRHIIVTV